MDSDFNRADIGRKSVRKPYKISKGFAPLPPPIVTKPQDNDDMKNTTTPILIGDPLDPRPPVSLRQIIGGGPVEPRNETKQYRNLYIQNIPLTTKIPNKNSEQVTVTPEGDSLSILHNIESQIDQFEKEMKTRDEDIPDGIQLNGGIGEQATKYRLVSNRYGQHENLLNSGISDISSKTGLCAVDDDKGDTDDDENQNKTDDFKRGVPGRNSTGGSIGITNKLSMAGGKAKIVKPVARTASDTKNAETTVKLLRLGLKKMVNHKNDTDYKTIRNTEPIHRDAIKSPMSPLSKHKKEDIIYVNRKDSSDSIRSSSSTTAQQNQQHPPPKILQMRKVANNSSGEVLKHPINPVIKRALPSNNNQQVNGITFGVE